MDWSEDRSNYESSSCPENVFPEQSQALALIFEGVSVCNRTRCWQLRLIEHSIRLDQRLRQRNKISVVAFLLPTLPPVARAKARASSRENRKTHRVSSVAEVITSGDSVLNDSRKGSGKGSRNGSRTFYLGAAWSFYSELFETVVLQADVVLDCGATETAGGVEAGQMLVDSVTPGFPDSRVEVDSLDRPWFRFVEGHWSRATHMGWITIYTLEAENVPVLAGMILLENHDISFRRNEFLVCDAEGHVRSVPLRRSPSGSEFAVKGAAHRVVSLSRATPGDYNENVREQKLSVSSACLFGLSRHPVAQFCQRAIPPPVNSHRTWSIPVSTQSDFAVFPYENLSQTTFLQSKLRLIRARLCHLQTVIDAREIDEPWTKCRNSTGLDWTRAFAHDDRDPRSWPQTRPRRGQQVLEQSYTTNQHGAWISCARCALRLHYVPRHTARMTSVSTASSASVQEALKRMSLLRDNDFTAKTVTDMIAEVEGRKHRKKKAPPQPTIVYNTVYISGAASSATISSGTTVHREISTPPTPRVSPMTRCWRLFCPEHPSVGTDQSATGKCSDNGRGIVKNLSGRLARKLQRRASLVNAGLPKQMQSVLDAAVVDRCGFVETCCSDAPCLTEAMQQRGIPSSSLLRPDGVGNNDAQTREKLLGWISEKRPRKAWFSPRVIAHQNNSTRCSLRTRQMFRKCFEYAAAVLQFCGHIYCEWPAKCARWSSVELRDFRAQQKCCGRELLMTACDSCCFAIRENSLLEHHRWQLLTSDPRYKEYMSLQCQGNHEHVWKHIHEGKREYPAAMIRRVVNGFVHDLRPPQLHMFCRKLTIWCPDLLQFLLRLLLKKPKIIIRRLNVSVFKKLIHRLHVDGGHVSKTSFEIVASASRLPCLDAAGAAV